MKTGAHVLVYVYCQCHTSCWFMKKQHNDLNNSPPSLSTTSGKRLQCKCSQTQPIFFRVSGECFHQQSSPVGASEGHPEGGALYGPLFTPADSVCWPSLILSHCSWYCVLLYPVLGELLHPARIIPPAWICLDRNTLWVLTVNTNVYSKLYFRDSWPSRTKWTTLIYTYIYI